MSIEMVLLTITCVVTITNFAFALVRTYVGWKTLSESREYWHSWKKRRKDVARDVLKSISISQLKRELKKREKKD